MTLGLTLGLTATKPLHLLPDAFFFFFGKIVMQK